MFVCLGLENKFLNTRVTILWRGDDYSIHRLSLNFSHSILSLSLTWHFQVSNFSGVLQEQTSILQAISPLCFFLSPSYQSALYPLSVFQKHTEISLLISSVSLYIKSFFKNLLNKESWEQEELKLFGQSATLIQMSMCLSNFKLYKLLMICKGYL